MNTLSKLGLVLMFASLLGACETLKPYEKEYLLDPSMDDTAVSRLESRLGQAQAARHERLATSPPAGGGATSCPTCGG